MHFGYALFANARRRALPGRQETPVPLDVTVTLAPIVALDGSPVVIECFL